MRKTVFWSAAAIAMGLQPAMADNIRLTIGAGHPDTAVWNKTITDYFVPEVSRRVAERTEHEIVWTEAFGGSVCKLGECLEAVQAGLLDMAQVQPGFEPSNLQANNFAYFVPFGLTDPVQGAKAFQKVYETVEPLRSVLSDRFNQTFVGIGLIGNYGVSTTFDWETIDDLGGHKIAAAGPNLPWLHGTGVTTVQTNLNEAYTALQTGVYDGWVMVPDALVSFKLIEVAKHYMHMGFGVIPTAIITINNDRLDDMPPEVREIIFEVGRDWNAHEAAAVAAGDEANAALMEAAGVTLKTISDEQRQIWADNLENLPGNRYSELVAKGQGEAAEAIYEYIRIAKEMGHVFPRDWEAERPE